MNAYEISIWKGVKHNGTFSHNIKRTELIHARNENEAKVKIKLEPKYTHEMKELTIEVSQEFIYSVHKIGTVRIEKFYTYSDGRNPILVKTRK